MIANYPYGLEGCSGWSWQKPVYERVSSLMRVLYFMVKGPQTDEKPMVMA
jgi:hypothetical protein